MRDVPFAIPTDIRCHHTYFSRHGFLAPGIGLDYLIAVTMEVDIRV